MFPKTEMNFSRIPFAPRSKTKPRARVGKATCSINSRGLTRYSIVSRISCLTSIFLICLLSAGVLLAEDFNGNVFVTDKTGAAKDNITYDSAGDAYLNGGPEGKNGSGLAPGTYYFQVTDPNGNMLLSTDNAECRQLTVTKNGRFAGAAGPASCG